jgi:tetratricopeptide (TPR) repeat protein
MTLAPFVRSLPRGAEAYGNLGNALKELGDFEGAIQFYLKAVKLKPRFSDAYNNLASAYVQARAGWRLATLRACRHACLLVCGAAGGEHQAGDRDVRDGARAEPGAR